MGPALLPAGTTLSMFRWSLSFTAAQKGRGVSPVCRSHFRISTKAAPWSITNNQGVVRQQARGCWSTAGCGAGKLERLLAGHTSNAPQGGLWLLTNDFVRLNAGLHLHMVTTSRTCVPQVLLWDSPRLPVSSSTAPSRSPTATLPLGHPSGMYTARQVVSAASAALGLNSLIVQTLEGSAPPGPVALRLKNFTLAEVEAPSSMPSTASMWFACTEEGTSGRHRRRVAHTTEKVVRSSSSCTPQGAAQAAAGAGRSKSNPACQKPGRQSLAGNRGVEEEGWSDKGSFWKAIHAWNG